MIDLKNTNQGQTLNVISIPEQRRVEILSIIDNKCCKILFISSAILIIGVVSVGTILSTGPEVMKLPLIERTIVLITEVAAALALSLIVSGVLLFVQERLVKCLKESESEKKIEVKS